MLLKWNAPVDIKDVHFDGTPLGLGWSLYGWCEPPPEANRDGYYDVVTCLVAAGATVQREWLNASKRGLPITEKIHGDKRMQLALKGSMPE